MYSGSVGAQPELTAEYLCEDARDTIRGLKYICIGVPFFLTAKGKNPQRSDTTINTKKTTLNNFIMNLERKIYNEKNALAYAQKRLIETEFAIRSSPYFLDEVLENIELIKRKKQWEEHINKIVANIKSLEEKQAQQSMDWGFE